MWKIWDHPLNVGPGKGACAGRARIRRRHRRRGRHPARHPQAAERQAQSSPWTMTTRCRVDYRMITQESMDSYPLSYTVEQYGYHPKKVALSFDDGPDPEWTPKILEILKEYNVKGTFFMIGEVAEDNIGVMRRVYREGHEIGNHTLDPSGHQRNFKPPGRARTEPDRAALRLQARSTAALLPAALLHRPGARHQRPGRSGRTDRDPRLHHHRQQDRHQRLGRHPRKTPQEITDSVFQQIADDGDKAVDSGLHHSSARRRRRPSAHGGTRCRC